MQDGCNSAVLDQMLEPVGRCLNQEAIRSLLALQVDKKTQDRVDALAEKCNEGQLTDQERDEYESYIQASTLIGILQAKARRILADAA